MARAIGARPGGLRLGPDHPAFLWSDARHEEVARGLDLATRETRPMDIRVMQAVPVEMDLGPAELGEGPVWLEDRAELAWVDIQRGLIYLLKAATGRVRTIALGEMVGSIAPTTSGSLVVPSPRDSSSSIQRRAAFAGSQRSTGSILRFG
jgi:hypothetical protein